VVVAVMLETMLLALVRAARLPITTALREL
jgi:hypothetical protein